MKQKTTMRRIKEISDIFNPCGYTEQDATVLSRDGHEIFIQYDRASERVYIDLNPEIQDKTDLEDENLTAYYDAPDFEEMIRRGFLKFYVKGDAV